MKLDFELTDEESIKVNTYLILTGKNPSETAKKLLLLSCELAIQTDKIMAQMKQMSIPLMNLGPVGE